MARKFLIIKSDWTGGPTRHDAASLYVEAKDGAKFDTNYGFGYVTRPGGGTQGNDGERVKSIKLTEDRFEVKWHETGGQSHTFVLKFADSDETHYEAGSSGPKGHIPNAVRDQEDEHI